MKDLKGNLRPWLGMWTHPKETIKAIVASNPKKQFYILSFVYGLPTLLNFAQERSLVERVPLVWVIFFSILLAVLVGVIGISVLSALLYWTGKLIGGKGTYLNVRAAAAWSNVPNVVTIAIWFILIGYFGSYALMSDFPTMPLVGFDRVLVIGLFFIQSVVAIWSFVILLLALAQVQGFSAWRALLNVILPMILLVVVIWILMMLVTAGAGTPT